MSNTFKRMVFAAAVAWLLALVPGYAQNELRPIYEKSSPRVPNFELEIIGGFTNNSGEIDHSSTTEFDMQTGHQTGGENSTDESIRERNDSKDYKFNFSYIGVRFNYRGSDNLNVWVGIGTANHHGKEVWENDPDIASVKYKGSVSYFVEGGLKYSYPITRRLFITAHPGIFFSSFNDMSMELFYEGGSTVLPNYDLDRNYLSWNVPVLLSGIWGKFTAYVGVSYNDFLITDDYAFVKKYGSGDTLIELEEKYRSSGKVQGLAGVKYFFARNISVGLNGAFGRNIGASLSFGISL